MNQHSNDSWSQVMNKVRRHKPHVRRIHIVATDAPQRRSEDKIKDDLKPMPWYAKKEAKEELLMTVALCAFAVLFPFAMNWLLNLVTRLQVFVR